MQLKHNWDFFGHRKVFYAIPLVIFAIILIFALIFGVKVDIQFTGGTIATYSYSGTIDRSAIASAAKEETGLSATVDTSQSLSSDSQQFSISFGNKQSLSMETQQALTDRLISDFPDNSIEQVSIDSVSATMGQGLPCQVPDCRAGFLCADDPVHYHPVPADRWFIGRYYRRYRSVP